MSSISGLEGLIPTIEVIKMTKKLQLQIRVDNMWMVIN